MAFEGQYRQVKRVPDGKGVRIVSVTQGGLLDVFRRNEYLRVTAALDPEVR